MTSTDVCRHVTLLPTSQKGPGQHLEAPWQRSWPLHEHDQRSNVKQGAGRHDYVCSYVLHLFPSYSVVFCLWEVLIILFVAQGREEAKDWSVPYLRGRHPKADTRWHEQTRSNRASSQVIYLPFISAHTHTHTSAAQKALRASMNSCPVAVSRLTIHMDEELRGLAFTTLQALMVDFPEWREDVLSGFVYFIVREVTDVHPTLLDNAVKMLLQLISQWRQAVQCSNKSHEVQVSWFLRCHKVIAVKSSEIFNCIIYFFLLFLLQGSGSSRSLSLDRSPLSSVLHTVEGLALVVLCSCRPATRRLAVNVLKEIRALHTALGIGKVIALHSECTFEWLKWGGIF